MDVPQARSGMSNRRKAASAAALVATAIAIRSEGIKLTPYYDPPRILTVCEGHTGPDVIAGRTYSLAECDAFLTADMRKAIAAVQRCAPDAPVNVLAAFGDATYNMGPTIACNTAQSTAARLLAAHQYEAACRELPRWSKARVAGVMVTLPGLTKRRATEMAVCLTPSKAAP